MTIDEASLLLSNWLTERPAEVAAQKAALDKYGRLFRPENIANITQDQFKAFLLFKNNRHWANIHRHSGIYADMNRLKTALKVLLDESRPIQIRLDEVTDKTSALYIKGLGRAVLTPILMCVYPDTYAVYNKISQAGLTRLGRNTAKPSDTVGRQYLAINEACKWIAHEINQPLSHVDAMFSLMIHGSDSPLFYPSAIDSQGDGEIGRTVGVDSRSLTPHDGTPFPSTAVNSVRTFLEAVWHVDSTVKTHITLYRGQARNLPLLPKLFRPPKGVKRNDSMWIQQIKDAEGELLSRFKNESPYLLPSKPDNDWDWLSLGQHFGLPTRLLDWTANPLTALFFAIESEHSTEPTVYIYHAERVQIVNDSSKQGEEPLRINSTRIFQPSWHSIRVAMQAGWHTVHRIYDQGTGISRVRPLTEMARHEGRTDVIKIDAASVLRLRDELSEMGIRHATVYGDLQSVCTSIRTSLGIG